MKRRNFLRNSSLAGIAITAARFNSTKENIPDTTNNIDGFDLNEATIDALQQKMQSGALSSVQITKKYLQRIQSIDKSGPFLNAVIEINPDALSIAAELDKERKQGKV